MTQITKDSQLLSRQHLSMRENILERAQRRAQGVRRVLVVDDIYDNADILATLVRGWGHEVLPIYDCDDAVATLPDFQPDVVIVEIGEMDGHELARQVRQLTGRDEIRLIAITAYGYESDYRQSVGAGFDHHLKTPADPSLLERLVKERYPARRRWYRRSVGQRDSSS